MIIQISEKELFDCLDVIHNSFMTVAEEFGLTQQNCSTNGAFMPYSRLYNDYKKGCLMYAIYSNTKIVGFVQLSKKENGAYELEKLAVLPDYRHNGYGQQLIDFCKGNVKKLGGNRITIGIIEENKRLKDWYISNGFIHTGTRLFQHLPFTVGFMEMLI